MSLIFYYLYQNVYQFWDKISIAEIMSQNQI